MRKKFDIFSSIFDDLVVKLKLSKLKTFKTRAATSAIVKHNANLQNMTITAITKDC